MSEQIEIILKLKEKAKQLRLYVHEDNPNCILNRCPNVCYIRKDIKKEHRLDLDTKIAWSIAEAIDSLIYSVKQTSKETFLDYQKTITILDDVIWQHKDLYKDLNKNRLGDLTCLINGLFFELNWLN